MFRNLLPLPMTETLKRVQGDLSFFTVMLNLPALTLRMAGSIQHLLSLPTPTRHAELACADFPEGRFSSASPSPSPASV
ncbi:MAG: hypothetical protein WD604_14085 [Balneolaceae bacterium]